MCTGWVFGGNRVKVPAPDLPFLKLTWTHPRPESFDPLFQIAELLFRKVWYHTRDHGEFLLCNEEQNTAKLSQVSTLSSQ